MLVHKIVNGLSLLLNKNIYLNKKNPQTKTQLQQQTLTQQNPQTKPEGSEALDAQTPPEVKQSLKQVC